MLPHLGPVSIEWGQCKTAVDCGVNVGQWLTWCVAAGATAWEWICVEHTGHAAEEKVGIEVETKATENERDVVLFEFANVLYWDLRDRGR